MKAGTRENKGLIWKNQYSSQRDTGGNAISGNLRDDVLLGLLVLRPTAAGKLGQHILALPGAAEPPGYLLLFRAGPGSGDRAQAIAREVTSQALTQQQN